MRIHHLDCGTMCPFGGRLMDGLDGVLRGAHIVCHCLLLEGRDGLVLVDTGLGLRDVDHSQPRLAAFFRGLMRPQLRAEQTAIAQVRALGFSPDDVRHVVLTHLDFDHAGGLEDFPQALVHVFEPELQAATRREGFIGRGRYRPLQWDEITRWLTYREQGETWAGFGCVRGLRGLDDEILMVPLIGHTWGHCGIAIRQPDGWLLHAGDAYFYRDEMLREPRCTPGLRAYQRMMEVNRAARLHNQQRLREMVHARPDVRVFSAHDPVELQRLRGATAPAQHR
jgi:glyoxylase-like metal-dependent hydrolase (beta-lactamase superfamily II)